MMETSHFLRVNVLKVSDTPTEKNNFRYSIRAILYLPCYFRLSRKNDSILS